MKTSVKTITTKLYYKAAEVKRIATINAEIQKHRDAYMSPFMANVTKQTKWVLFGNATLTK